MGDQNTVDVTPDFLQIRSLKHDEFGQLYQLAKEAGWSSHWDDIEIMRACAQEAFVAAVSDTNALICVCLLAPYGEHGAYLSYFTTNIKHRNQGIGTRVLKAALQKHKHRHLVLDAVSPWIVSFYDKMGFKDSGIKIFKFNGIKSNDAGGLKGVLATAPKELIIVDGQNQLENVIKYDRVALGRDRRKYLSASAGVEHNIFKCALMSGIPVGYGMMRLEKNGWKLFMLYADDYVTAAAILYDLLTELGDSDETALSYFTTNWEVTNLMTLLGVDTRHPNITEYRMQTDDDVHIDYSKIWFYANVTHEPC